MSSRHLVLLLILGAIAAQCAYYYPLLPERVASHFGPGGDPNGWMPRDGFFVFYAVLLGVLTFAMFALPILLHHYQVTAINIPNRDYWIAPERRQQAYAMLTNELAWFGNAILAFMLSVMQLVFESNVAATRLDESRFLALLAIFVGFVIFWMVRLYRRFAIPAAR